MMFDIYIFSAFSMDIQNFWFIRLHFDMSLGREALAAMMVQFLTIRRSFQNGWVISCIQKLRQHIPSILVNQLVSWLWLLKFWSDRETVIWLSHEITLIADIYVTFCTDAHHIILFIECVAWCEPCFYVKLPWWKQFGHVLWYK